MAKRGKINVPPPIERKEPHPKIPDVVQAQIIETAGVIIASICSKAPNDFHNQLLGDIDAIDALVISSLADKYAKYLAP